MSSHKHAKTKAPINKLISKRWSTRAYDPAKPVSDDQILSLAEAARWAPSSSSNQPWRFVFFNRTSNQDAWQQALSCLNPSNQAWAQNAPVLVLVCAYDKDDRYQQENRWAEYDTGSAAENLCLQATDLGLMTRQIGGFDLEKTRNTMSIPDDFSIMAFIAVGYQGATETLNNKHHAAQENAEREREPLSSHFYLHKWGIGLQ